MSLIKSTLVVAALLLLAAGCAALPAGTVSPFGPSSPMPSLAFRDNSRRDINTSPRSIETPPRASPTNPSGSLTGSERPPPRRFGSDCPHWR